MSEEYSEIKVEQYIRKEYSSNSPRNNGGGGNGAPNWIIYSIPLLLVLVAALFYNIGASKFKTAETIEREEKLTRLSEVIQMVELSYVDSVDVEALYESSINGMLKKLDPHSVYIPKEDVEQSNEQLQGHFGGVGIRFIILRDTLMITNVIEGGPSQKAGLKSGDRIVKVNDENIASIGLDIEGVHERLKGTFASNVTLSVYRLDKKKIIDFPIQRGDIPLPSVDAAYLIEDGIGVIKINSFSSLTDVEFDEAITKLKKQGVKKIIMDLRHNGGGYMHTAINVADEFLSNGKLIVYTEGVNSPKYETFATSFGQCENMPLAILINSGSASASEIVSGALQDNDRAIIIGRRSFGKGLVQRPFDLPDGSELRLTVSRYYTPTGRSIQKPYGEGIDYGNDIYDRYENGELQEIDSSIFENAPKFTTPKGKTVYGGGGIMPDVFVPIDTAGSSLYLTALNYSDAYRNFCFDYLDKHRKDFTYRDEVEYNNKFNVSDQLLEEFLTYAEENEGIKKDPSDLKKSKYRIVSYLKSELATYLYDGSARYLVNIPLDKEIQVAIQELKK
jgi:carboxyl-terminal processing protease